MGLLSDVAFCSARRGLRRKTQGRKPGQQIGKRPCLLPAGPGRGLGGRSPPSPGPVRVHSGGKCCPPWPPLVRVSNGRTGPWLLEGQTPVAGVLLRAWISFRRRGRQLRAEGTGREATQRAGSTPQSAAPRPPREGSWAPLQSGWQPRMTGFAPSLLRRKTRGQGAGLLSQTWAWAPQGPAPRPDPLPRSRVRRPPSLAYALTVFQLVHHAPQRPK